MQKQCFSEKSLHDFLLKQKEKVKLEISDLSNDDIAKIDINKWVDYFADRYRLEPIVLLDEKENLVYDLQETKIDMSHSLNWGGGFADGYNLIFTVSYFGDSRLFDYRPSTYALSTYLVDNFIKSTSSKAGSFNLVQEYNKADFDKRDTSPEYIYQVFVKLLETYKIALAHVCNEIKGYNNSLEKECRSCLEKRKEKADSYIATRKKINIPLQLNPNAPNVTPIKIPPRSKPRQQRPTHQDLPPEYGIEEETYKNINNIISMCGRTMENALRTFCKLDEEELRDILLATLSTHYEKTTGETFRKNGKTDILIEAENKAAFVGECKLWKGQKALEEAIKQVLGYSTWRDGKISLIIFNKSYRNFLELLEKIDSWVRENAKRPIRGAGNIWNTRYFRKDTEMEIDLCILIFDLYQATDKRDYT